MIRNIVSSFVGAVVLATGSLSAYASDLFNPYQDPGNCLYARGDIGLALSDVEGQPDSEAGLALGFGLGCQFTPMFRADVTFDAALGYDWGAVDGDSISVMGNGYIDWNLGQSFKPYFGGGIGWGRGRVSQGGFSGRGDGIALAGMAGVGFDVAPNMVLDTGYKYRYIDAGPTDWGDHMFRLGIRYKF